MQPELTDGETVAMSRENRKPVIQEKGLLLVFLIITCSLIFYALIRDVDGDEGYYLAAGQLVMAGKVPYLDFLYPQMPLLPFVLAGWLKLFGVSWYTGRTLSVLCGLISLVLMSYYLRLKKFPPSISVIALVLFAYNQLTVLWFSVAKTYSITTCLSLASFVSLVLYLEKKQPRYLLLAGFLIGLAGNIRAFYLPLLLVVPAFLFVRAPKTKLVAALLPATSFVGGALLASGASLILFVEDHDSFLFDNFTFQVLSRAWKIPTLKEAVAQKISVALQLLAMPQIILFLLLGVAALIASRRKATPELMGGGDWALALVFFVTLALISIAAWPTYVQYFSVCIPFLAILLTPALLQLYRQMPQAVVWCIILVYVSSGAWGLCQSTSYCRGDPDWSIHQISQVNEKVDSLLKEGDQVLTFWPGYVFSTKGEIAPGFENHFAVEAALQSPDLLSDEVADRFHIASMKSLETRIKNKQVAVIVLGNWMRMNENDKQNIFNLVESHYVEREAIGNARLYIPR